MSKATATGGTRPPTRDASTNAAPDAIEKLLEAYQGNMYPGIVEDFARDLGVSPDAVRRTAIGFAPIVEFKKGKNYQGWFAIPERDADGEPIGISLRSQSGMKVMSSGSKHGMIYEVNPEHDRGNKGYDSGAHNWTRTLDAGVDCPVCGKPDGCLTSSENPSDPKAVICIRKESARPMRFGWLHIRKAEGNLAGKSALADNGGPVIVVEGASDQMAALDLGFNAIGRPSNLACMDMLVDLVRGRSVVVVGESDKKPDGSEPGRDGMIAAFKMAKLSAKGVTMLMPPEHVKDLRAWVVKYKLTREQFDLYHAEHKIEHTDADPIADKSIARTDNGNAKRFVEKHRGDVLHDYGSGTFYVWDGRRYCPDRMGLTFGLVKNSNESIFHDVQTETNNADRAEILKWAILSQSVRSMNAVMTMIRSDLAINPNELDRDPRLLNCLNGVVDLKTGQLFPHNKSHRMTKLTRVAYVPDAPCPHWHKFLADTFHSNPPLVPCVQRLIGYSTTGETNEQKLPFLHGPGANGKSTLLEAVAYSLGDYAAKAAPDLLMARTGSAHPCDMADLQGSRLVISSETRDGHRLDEARVKDLTGEKIIKARKMHTNFYEFPVTHKLFLYSNHRPIIQGTDHGIWRRIILIPFIDTVSEEMKDKSLGIKLEAEAEGILAWAVRGAVEWYRSGLALPDVVTNATKEYRASMDVIGAFIADCCVEFSNASIGATPLYETYRRWAEENGERVDTQKRFGMTLADRGYEHGFDSTKRRLWKGITIRQKTGTEQGRDNVNYG